MSTIINVTGWIGSVIVVLAYGLNSYQKIKSDSLLFYSLNLSGGILLIIYAVYLKAYPNAFINIVWVIIALPAMFKILTRK